ncbi:MAG TPA: TolC family protein, partial [Polyangiaceae bacterium]
MSRSLRLLFPAAALASLLLVPLAARAQSTTTTTTAKPDVPKPAPPIATTPTTAAAAPTATNQTAAQAAPIPSPANNASSNVAAQPPVAIPAPPTVDDPMLAPVPAATKVVSTWAEALSLVKTNSTDLAIAYDEVRRAEAQWRTALAGTLPSLNGNMNYNHQFLVEHRSSIDASGAPISTTTPQYNSMGGSISLSQGLFIPRVWHSIGTASRQEDVANLSLEDEKRAIALGVANAVIAVVTQERIAELNRSGFRAALERLDLTRRKQALGAATGLDVVRAQQDVESARAGLVTGDESLRQSREALGLALGMPAAVGVNPQISLDSLVDNAMGSCKRTNSLEDRADIAASRVRADIASRGVDDAWLQFSPTITAGSGINETFIDPGSPNPTWNIQAVLSVPIWDGGARYGALRSARVDEDEAKQNLTALRRNAQIQLVQAQRGVQVAESSRKVASDNRALAAETDRLTQVG